MNPLPTTAAHLYMAWSDKIINPQIYGVFYDGTIGLIVFTNAFSVSKNLKIIFGTLIAKYLK